MILLLFALLWGSVDALALRAFVSENACTGDFGSAVSCARYFNPQTGRFWTADDDDYGDEEEPPSLHLVTSAGMAFSKALFLWLRKWLAEPAKETREANLLRTALCELKRATPRVLAGIAWLPLFVLVGAAANWCLRNVNTLRDWQFWILSGSSALVVVLTAWLSGFTYEFIPSKKAAAGLAT